MQSPAPIRARSPRREAAITAAKAASEALAALGVRVLVTGSLARGGFGPGSDIDLLVTACPRHLKYAIEGIVEDATQGFAFDLVYEDELPPWKLPQFRQGAVDASLLG